MTVWEDVLLVGAILLLLGKIWDAPLLVGIGALAAIGSVGIPYFWEGITDFFNGLIGPLGLRNII